MKKITLLFLMCFSSFLGFAQVALTEGFDSTVNPSGGTWALDSGTWAIFDNGVGTQGSWTPTSSPALVHQGTRSVQMNGTNDNLGLGNTSQDWLVTPAVTVPANGQLKFFTRLQTAGDQGSVFQIRISTTSQTDVSTFTILQQWNELNLNASFNTYEEKTVPLNLPAGSTVYVAFVMLNTQLTSAISSERWLVDTVNIVEQCVDPTNLGTGAVTPTSASLTWNNPGGSTEWEIEIVSQATPTPTGHGVIYNGAPPYLATGTATGSPLQQIPFISGEDYKYYVRAVCSSVGGTSNWVGPFSFSISAIGETCSSAIQIPSLPYNTSGDTANYGDTVEGAPGAGCGTTSFYLNGNDVFYAYTATETGIISITMTPTGSYSGLFVYNGCANVGVSCVAGVASSTIGVREIPLLSVTAGQTYIIVISTWAAPQTTAYDLVIQKVNCTPPTALTASNFGQTSATLAWGNPGNLATSWQVDVQTAGTPIPTGEGVTTTNNTAYPAGGLTASTAYRYYVRADCGDGTFSAWAGPFLFNTTSCDVADQCVYKFVMTDSFGDGWNGNTMTIRQNGVAVATIGSTFTAGAGPVTVNVPLCDGLPFELFWNSGGSFSTEVGVQIIDAYEEDVYTKPPGQGSTNSLLYSGVVNCAPPTCPKPQNLAVVSTGLTSAVLNWTEMGGATSWELVYQPAGSLTPTGTSVIVNAAPPYTLEGLTSGTAYSFFVRALCSDTDLSNWSGPRNFATAIANDDCANATVVPVNPDLNCTQVASGILIGATASPEANTCFGSDDDDVWFQFVATATTHSIALQNITGSTTDLYHVLYEGDQCGSLTQLYCSDPNTSQANGLTIGNTYKIRVYSYSSTPQTSAFDVCVKTPVPPIAVNDTQYTIEQLVQEVLIGSECAIVTNVTSRTGTNFGQANGIGYFDQNGSNFPFANGVVLATGNISQAEGPYPGTNTGIESSAWLGDADLNALIVPGGNILGLNNASVLEFDFVPLTNEISFDFLFASSEYGSFQCSYSDAFAFILTGADGVSQNLAVIPGTTTPVSVVNIRDGQYNSSCASANVEYFGQYNVNDPEASAIGYGGQTVVMTAQSPVNIGETYHIKLVIADYNDSSFNSAVFLAGGSFNIGDIQLGADLTVAGGNAVCGGEPFTITSGLDPDDYDFVWTDENGAVIPNENGPNLTVTQTGTYTLAAAFTGSTCAVTASVRIEFYDEIEVITGVPNDLTACDPDGFATFDLSTNTTVLLTGLNAADYDVTYHATQADADANINPLPLSFENTVQFLQPVFARIYNNVTECVGSKTFNLIVQDLSPQFTLTSDFSLCEGTSGTITVTPTNFNVADVTFTWTLDGTTTLPDTGSSITVSDEGFYEVTINNNGCSVTDGTTVLVVPMPVAVAPQSSTNCESYVLPVLAEGNYFTATGGTGTQLAAGSLVTATQTIFVYAQSGTTPNCTDEESFIVTIIPALQASVNGSCEGSNYVMEVLPIESSFDSSTVTYAWALASASGTILGTDQTLTVTEAGNYVVTVTTAGATACSETFEFTANGTTCMIPKGISPNGDGKNDTFDLTGLQVRKISIFNRYGTIVYDYSNYTDQWHGQSNKGDELPDGTYYYSFEREGGESKTGWVYINRQRN